MAADVDVVVFDENELVGELGIAHELRDLLKHTLAWFIQGMSFPGKHELYRLLRVVDHRSQKFDIADNEVGALISSEAAREANGQSVRAENAAEILQAFRGLSPA